MDILSKIANSGLSKIETILLAAGLTVTPLAPGVYAAQGNVNPDLQSLAEWAKEKPDDVINQGLAIDYFRQATFGDTTLTVHYQDLSPNIPKGQKQRPDDGVGSEDIIELGITVGDSTTFSHRDYYDIGLDGFDEVKWPEHMHVSGMNPVKSELYTPKRENDHRGYSEIRKDEQYIRDHKGLYMRDAKLFRGKLPRTSHK